MKDIVGSKNDLLEIAQKLEYKNQLSRTVEEDYFEPGMMENLEQYKGIYDESTNTVILRMEAKGLRYDNRTYNLEQVSVGDKIELIREFDNPYNSNNFKINSENGKSLGNCSLEFCNTLAPLYDGGYATILDATVTYIEHLKDRSRYAKQGVLFFEVKIKLRGI